MALKRGKIKLGIFLAFLLIRVSKWVSQSFFSLSCKISLPDFFNFLKGNSYRLECRILIEVSLKRSYCFTEVEVAQL